MAQSRMVLKVIFFTFFFFNLSFADSNIDLKLTNLEKKELLRQDFYPSYKDEIYINSKIGNEFFELFKFVNKDYQTALYCPNETYLQNEKYIKYLFRIMALESLFNAVENYSNVSDKFGLKVKCDIDWKDFFSKCRPKSKNMIFFLKSLNYFYLNQRDDSKRNQSIGKDEFNQWYQDLLLSKQDDLTHTRLISLNKKISKQSISNEINSICQDDLMLMRNICNEDDFILGASYSPSLFNAVLYSGGLSLIENPYQYGCTQQFVINNIEYEKKLYELKGIFKLTQTTTKKVKIHEYGLLKNIQDQGLESLFLDKSEKSNKKEEPKGLVVSETKPKFEKIHLKKFNKKIKKFKRNIVSAKKKMTTSFKSSFLISSRYRREKNLLEVRLDMFKFKNDYIFTEQEVGSISKSIPKFVSYKALREMKRIDKLGTKKAPFPLTFIKFLIDEDMHKELFNITNVIGNNFYVLNNIDKNISDYEHIRLVHSAKTNLWEISIID